ncbi:MAG TPA: PAS domain-containing protein, partial [Alphaproteobacteria bacterium]
MLDFAQLLGALPYAIVVLSPDDSIRYVNPAGEQFFGQGAGHLRGQKLSAFVPADSPVFSLLAQARGQGASVTEYDVSIALPRIAARLATIQAAPFGEGDAFVVVSLHEQTLARKMDRQLVHRNAARSVTAMSAI